MSTRSKVAERNPLACVRGKMSDNERGRRERLRRFGLAVGCTIGGIGAGIMVLAAPFVSPGFRRFALPFVPATPVQLEAVLRHVRGRAGRVVDLGSGDGRVVIALARQGHYAVGYELNLWLVLYSRWRALVSGVHSTTEFHRRNLWKVCVCVYRLQHTHSISPSHTYELQADLSGYENIIFFGVESMVCKCVCVCVSIMVLYTADGAIGREDQERSSAHC